MRRSRLVAVMLSLIVLTGTTLIMSGAPVQAGGQPSHIESDFRMVENEPFTPIPGTGAGSGSFTLNGKHLQNVNLEIEANGLAPNTEYYLAVTVRNGFDGTIAPIEEVFVGTATTNGVGRLEFKGKGVIPAEAFDVGTIWRIDQQVRIVGGLGGTLDVCFECVLVCRPTTKVKLVDGKLVEF